MALAVLLVTGVAVACSGGDPGGSGADPAATVSGSPPDTPFAVDPATAPPPQWSSNTAGTPDFSNFLLAPNNYEGADPPQIVDSPNMPGRKAIRFDVPGGGKRCEVEPNDIYFGEGDDRWFGLAQYLPADFPVNTEDWQVVAQWKNEGEGSPPLEVKVKDGQFVLDGGAGSDDPGSTYFSTPIGPARTGVQTNLVVHVSFSSTPGDGVVDVWQNGQHRVIGYRPPGGTLYSGADSYLKTGIYRDTAIDAPATLFLNEARIATSFESAAALASPTGSG